MIECDTSEIKEQFSELTNREVPPVMEEDKALYTKFLEIVGETAIDHKLPIEKFAFDSFRQFSIPTVDFPGRDTTAHFQKIVEFVDNSYQKKKDPRPLRVFMKEYGSLVGYTATETPLMSKAHLGEKMYELYVTSSGKRPMKKMIEHEKLRRMVSTALDDLKRHDKDHVIRFSMKKKDDGSTGYAFEVVDRSAKKTVDNKPSVSGVYTKANLKDLKRSLEDSEKAHDAASALSRMYTYARPMSEYRKRNLAASKMASKFYKVNPSKDKWTDAMGTLRSEGILSDFYQAVGRTVVGGVDQVGMLRDEGLKRLRGTRVSLKSGREYRSESSDDSSDDEQYDSSDDERDAHDSDVPQKTFTYMKVKVVSLNENKFSNDWPEKVYGAPAMTYEIVRRKLQQWMNIHNFPYDPLGIQNLRCVAVNAGPVVSYTFDEDDSMSFEDDTQWKIVGASYTPTKELVDESHVFAAGVPIKMLFATRAHKDGKGAWEQYRVPIGTSKEGQSIYITETASGVPTGIIIETTKYENGDNFWNQVVYPF